MSSGLPTLRIIYSHLRAAQAEESREQGENGIGERGKVKWNPVTSREEYLNTYLTQLVPAPCFI
jgi:hypothetical protein